ncbi:uncharacterized protein [Atheta coriaria]|uniref:uncharacterized protein n=1 Tax=Dalotia coriaria TaxID=877792 RepID=UPI0031F4776A
MERIRKDPTPLCDHVFPSTDVHVKRIVPREGSRPLGALSGDGEGHLVRAHVRKERLTKNKHQLAEEAAKVLTQVDRIDCLSSENGSYPEKFHTLPARRKLKQPPEFSASLDRRARRRNSADLVVPPKKPPRTFANTHQTLQLPVKPKKSSLRRAVSDAAGLRGDNELRHRREKTAGEGEDASAVLRLHHKKQLSPIIEVTQREDYFTPTLKPSTSFKENDKNVDNDARAPARRKKPAQHQQHSVGDDRAASAAGAVLHTTNSKPTASPEIKNQVVVIDVDKATKIGKRDDAKDSKLSAAAIGRKIKSLAIKTAGKKKKSKDKLTPIAKTPVKTTIPRQEVSKYIPPPPPLPLPANSLVKDAIDSIHNRAHQSEMIHSSQQPVERLPLTRGRTVDTMVKKLSYESSSPPPKTNIMITPNVSVQHNNNQPFSYTRGLSPERSPTSPTSPIIYAQVVCTNGTNGTGGKQTVHTAYTGKKHLPHSDSDEGLGYEENSGFRSSEKSITHFGDDKYNMKTDYYNNGNNDSRFEEEYPITPKFQSNAYNGYHYDSKFTKVDQGMFIDSSSRGRGDGMDSKRRESLTETFENGTNGKFISNNNVVVGGGRKDLSARRDLLESRITRRFGEKRGSPEYSPKPTYITETTTRYYRSGSASPVPGRDKITSETKVETKKYQTEKYRYGFDPEPKSFDSQASDYRSSPESRPFETSHRNTHTNKYTLKSQQQQQLTKDRNFYKSNPEIHMRSYNYDDHRRFHDSYHDSLKRGEIERKDKFGDSGIENDFRRDSGERRKRGECSNESEDEGFASSLLIASERQHTEDNFARRNRRGYDSDRGYIKDDDYRNLETMEYRKYKHDYAPRERSIDDGSHFDPRIDKNVLVDRRNLKKIDKKPPKPEKKSNLEKVKQLFTSSKKKKEKQAMVREESLRARYTEYKGGETKFRASNGPPSNTGYDYRRRISPSPSPTRENQRKPTPSLHSSWFKSLDRLSRKKTKKLEKDGNQTSTEDEITKPTKSLRFFGDTDQESNDSVPHKSALKQQRSALTTKHRSQSTRDLHNISEESHKRNHHKSMLNIHSETERDAKGRMILKPPVSPSHRVREPAKQRDDRSRRRKNEVSSVESSTEGDSSQQSQRSVVYLHAATVGDIPGPGYLRNGRRAASREELASNGSSRIQPHAKTLSRSFSVLAPWRPRHYQEGMDIDYTQYPKPVKNGKYEQYRSGSSRRESSTLKKKAAESRRSNQNISTLGNKKSRSKENISTLKRGEVKSSSSSLYKKKERQPKENNRYNREEKRMASKSMSVESLGSNRSGSRKGEVSRSVSMPRDPEKSAGWFNMSKKSKKHVEY